MKMYSKKALLIGAIVVSFCVSGCDSDKPEDVSNSTQTADVIESSTQDVDKTFFEKTPLANNPYIEYKDFPRNSVEYLAYCVNQYVGPYFNEERNAVIEAIKTHPEKIPVKWDKDHWVRTRSSNEYYYCGEMKDNKPNGKGAVYKILSIQGDSSRFTEFGEFKDGKIQGYSVIVLAAQEMGSYIKKEYYESVANSKGDIEKGILYEAKDNDDVDTIYVGNFNKNYEPIKAKFFENKVGLISLDGKSTDYPVLTYFGEFKNNHYNGEGILYYSDGITKAYEGGWKSGRKEGHGTLFYPSGKIQYKGEFLNNEYNGKGILYKEDGSIEYDGNWKNGDYDIK